MVEPSRLIRLLGETLREIGILVAVFAPLDALFAERITSPGVIIAVATGGTVLIVGGILMEARR
jgi:hypothetical protein